jgi:predicted AlkP superfamily pyrophosphatase or phosphodiesterase
MVKKLYIFLISICIFVIPLSGNIPKITLVIVVDQLAYQTFDRLSPYFKYGFKNLLNNGVCFTNAHHPHGNPVTATGHTTISTGAYAKDHGVVLNGWMEEDGSFVDFGDDIVQNAAVFSKNGFYDYGLSAHHILIETLSDQLILKSTPFKNFSVYAIAGKSRAAIAMAGKLGKAIWFDDQAKQYTSSKAYFKQLPPWLRQFNQQCNLAKLPTISWQLFYDKNTPPYKFPFINNYQFAASNDKLAGCTIKLARSFDKIGTNNSEDEEFLYEQTPTANKTLINLCKTCINAHDLKKHQNNLMLWVSVSNFDLIGHTYGHDSFEAIDLLYHLDQQLDELITYAQKKVGKKNTLIVLTADHGCAPIPEVFNAQGYDTAHRIDIYKLQKDMNNLIEQEFGIEKIVTTFKNNQFFLTKKFKKPFDSKTHDAILNHLKKYLNQQPGIKNCWTKQELETTSFDTNHLEQYYKNQYHPLRSGDLIVMPFPYVYVAKYPTGTGHTTPYAYDTQVPLILYQYGSIEKKKHAHRVHITQLVPTLAHLLKVPCPSGAVGNQLLR